MPTSHPFGRAAVIDEHIYYFGGGNGQIDVLEPQQGKWSRLSSGITSRQILGDQIDGKLYLMDVVSRNFFVIDPETGRRQTLADVPTRRVNGTLIAAVGRLYAIGGYSKDVNGKNCVEVYDPQTNRWSPGPPLPGFRPLDQFHCAAVLDGELHVVGGLLEGNKRQPHWRLDGDRWTKCAEPPLHAMWKHAAVAAVGKKLYLIAPLPASPQLQSIETDHNIHAYHPATDQWRPVGQTPKTLPVGLFAQAVVGEKIYLLGGDRSMAVHVFNTAEGMWE